MEMLFFIVQFVCMVVSCTAMGCSLGTYYALKKSWFKNDRQ